MEAIWSVFCENIECSAKSCHPYYSRLIHPYSCINHLMIICFDILLLFVLLLFLIKKKPQNSATRPPGSLSGLQIASAAFNGVFGLVYSCFGIWVLIKNLGSLHWWLLAIVHGLTWLILGLTVSLKGRNFQKTNIKLLSVLAFAFSGVAFVLSVFSPVFMNVFSIKVAMDVLSFIGSGLLLLCTYKGFNYEQINETLYTPLITKDVTVVTPFAKANIFSKMSFWWLNSIMKLGKMKTLEDVDMPRVREEDGAQACYSQFIEKFDKQKELNPSSQSPILKTLVMCYWKEILVSGIFALVKIITVSAGPLLLKAFIKVAEGNESFENEGYVLAISLFFTKTIESLAERQWFFRSRLVGLKVRSFLSAAIYKKQFRLSNAAKMAHSAGEITNYVTVDAYRIGEFPFWCHQTWTTLLQLCLALFILYNAVGLATVASLIVIILTVAVNAPLAKLMHKYQTKFMIAQDARLKASSEAVVNMKVLKLYAWENHFKNVIEKMREVECKWLKAVNLRRAYNSIIFWASPVLVSVVTFSTCHLLGIPLYASNVFTFVATLRLVQDPVRSIPDVIGVVIQAQVSFSRVVTFLEAPELDNSKIKENCGELKSDAILVKDADFSWEEKLLRPTLKNINLEVQLGEKVAICGEVGSGKSTLLAAVLGEVPNIRGNIQVCGSMAYVSQSAWIQTGTIRDNILFGSELEEERYQETLEKCCLLKDLELLPYGDLTEIGQKGVNLSGGQKQRIQLARALYQNTDVYLLDDPFSAVDAHTASSLLHEYVMGALAKKTVLLVTHQVDFLPAFDSVLLMSDGEIIQMGPYHQLLDSSKEFQDLVNAHKETAGTERLPEISSSQKHQISKNEIKVTPMDTKAKATVGDQLIKKEERETGDSGFKPYLQYMNQNMGYFFFAMASFSQLAFVVLQILQNSWMAANVDNPEVSSFRLIIVYLIIGLTSTVFLLIRSLSAVSLGMRSSRSLFSQILNSLFRAPVSFYDSTPLGRILSRVSTDLNIVDLDVGFCFTFAVGATMSTYSNLVVLAVITWQVLFVSVPMVMLALCLQRYYYASAKELMRINGTTKSFVANHLSESIAGSMTIRAFKEEERFFNKNLELIDVNASPFFLNFAAKEWLILRLETLSALVLGSSALCMVLLPPGTFTSGFIGMALSYGLSLNTALVRSIQNQCTLANYIISVERLCQYTNIPSEAPEIILETRPPPNWPSVGKVEIQNLQIRYRLGAPLVICGISCTFEGGHKIGIVGRTGSGKTTLTGCLFRLVEPTAGRIVVDGIDISTLGLHDLRSRFGIIPQDPTLFNGTVRYNLDPLSQHTDREIWEVLAKCQLRDSVQEKNAGLDSMVMDDGSNWSMGQRQLFCLGRALLRRSKLLVLDEATASIDNATDTILQKTIRTEFSDCTVITVAHRIPTVMDCTKVLAISDGVLIEYDEPMNLMKREDSLFRQLVEEYWSHFESAELH